MLCAYLRNFCRYQRSLLALEDAAKAKESGVFAKDEAVLQHARVHIEKPFRIRGPEEEESEDEEAFFDATQAYKEWREQTLDGMPSSHRTTLRYATD